MFKKLKKKIDDIRNDEEEIKALDWQAEVYRKLKVVRDGRKQDRKNKRS